MQPTHARWEYIRPPQTQDLDTVEIVNSAIGQNDDQDEATKTIFPPIPPVYTRNFMISDTYYTTPASSTLGYPGPDGDVLDVGPPGLNSISEDVVAALHENCRKAFIETRAKETDWKESWSNERHDTQRSRLKITCKWSIRSHCTLFGTTSGVAHVLNIWFLKYILRIMFRLGRAMLTLESSR